MNTRKTLAALLCGVMLVTSVSASAQFGGMAKRLADVGESSVSSADADVFLTNALASTKNVMVSAALLSQAIADRSQLASKKEYITAIQTAQSFKELGAHNADLQSDLDAIGRNADFAAAVKASYDAGNAEQKELIGAAVFNLALGIYRNVQLIDQAPDMVKNVGSNPQLITRLGEFRTAASLLGLQGEGLTTIGTTLPKLMSSMKIEAPLQASTTEAKPVNI